MQRDLVALNERILLMEQRNRELEQREAQAKRDIKSRIEDYSKTREEKEQVLRKQSAGLQAMFDEFREEIQSLRGKLEESDYLLKRKIAAFEDTVKKNQKRLEALDRNLRSRTFQRDDSGIRTPEAMSPGSEPGMPSGNRESGDSRGRFDQGLSDNELYVLSKQAFDQKAYEKARDGFKLLLEKYPNSKRADNSQFWLGEIYYQQKWYEKAILEYQSVIEKYPTGNKVKAALLKQGFSFLNLGDKANGRLILQELIDRYPQSHEADIAEQKLNSF
ncbi:tol-pal system protein YbgF [Desulfonema magnum]|uniref:tol-pal system protein YbgF n=1 Tax=Desulfonema magnum TaxID=45655 RepID=UPI001A9AF7C3|nr:tol-pal system protein YbgF [Desulfonema magnum]